MGALNTFFNWRTSHHTKVTAKNTRPGRQPSKVGWVNALNEPLIGRKGRRADAAEAARYRQLGEAALAPAPQTVAPGWYPDHDQRGMLRYWDGVQWTNATSDNYDWSQAN